MESLPRSVCRSCRTGLSRSVPPSARAFSSSAITQSIPPESPQFVDVPQSFQPSFVVRKQKKGYLPTPKEIFPRTLPNKPTQAYIDALTREPQKTIDLNDPNLPEQSRYKARMSALRRSHLRTSLSELHARKTTLVNRVQLRSQMKQIESQRLVNQPPREDERLTNVSIPSTMSPLVKHHFTPAEAQEEHIRKTANVQKHEAAREAERADQLHTMYMTARKFITDEEQLKAVVEEEFRPDKFGTQAGFMSIWGSHGRPASMKELLHGQWAGAAGGQRSDDAWAREKNEKERMKRIGEKLSGGKI